MRSLASKRAKIIIPTPVLSEVLLGGRRVDVYLEGLRKYACFQVRAFDERAAIELSARIGSRRNKARFKKTEIWNKLKFDRQIVAIAQSQGATVMYSDDNQVRAFAIECGMRAFSLMDIPVPIKQEQLELKDCHETKDDDPPTAELRRGSDGHPKGEARTEGEGSAKGTSEATEGSAAAAVVGGAPQNEKPASEAPSGKEEGSKVVDAEGIEPSSAESQGAVPKPEDNPPLSP